MTAYATESKAFTVPNATDYPIAIVGAGFSGLGMAACLLRAGVEDFIILVHLRIWNFLMTGRSWRRMSRSRCSPDQVWDRRG